MTEKLVLTLAEWRGLRGLTKVKLAEKVGLSARTIYNYESDVKNLRRADYETIKTIADALDIKVSQIFLDYTSEKPKQEVK